MYGGFTKTIVIPIYTVLGSLPLANHCGCTADGHIAFIHAGKIHVNDNILDGHIAFIHAGKSAKNYTCKCALLI